MNKTVAASLAAACIHVVVMFVQSMFDQVANAPTAQVLAAHSAHLLLASMLLMFVKFMAVTECLLCFPSEHNFRIKVYLFVFFLRPYVFHF